MLPKQTKAVLKVSDINVPPIFHWLQNKGNIQWEEMFRTFNCGVGMAVIVPSDYKETAIALLMDAGETAWEIGQIFGHDEESPAIEMLGSPS